MMLNYKSDLSNVCETLFDSQYYQHSRSEDPESSRTSFIQLRQLYKACSRYFVCTGEDPQASETAYDDLS